MQVCNLILSPAGTNVDLFTPLESQTFEIQGTDINYRYR